MWYLKYSLPCTNLLGFIVYRVTSTVLGVGAADRSWSDVKKIKSGKRYAISIYESEKQSIVYAYACIESAIIEQHRSDKQINENCSSHTWNKEDNNFYQKLEKMGCGKVFSYQS